MKTFLRIVNTLMIMAIVAIAVAKEPLPAFKFQVLNANSFVLYLNNQGGKNIKITIKDQQDIVLYTDKLVAEIASAKKYNLSNLPVGSYILVIENELGISEHEINLTGKELEIANETLNYYPKPQFVENGKFLDIMFSSIENAPVKVRIFSSEELIFSETIESEDLIQRRYDLSKLVRGTYSVSIKSNGRVFSESIDVE